MKTHRRRFPRRLCLVVLGTFLLPPGLWSAVLLIVPTDCARRSIAERLSASSGRAVTLGGVRVGFLGGVSLTDLRIGAPQSLEQPWLVVDEASIDVSMLQLLFGTIEPTRIEVAGLTLRVLRRNDGGLELADFLRPDPNRVEGTLDEESSHGHGDLEFLVHEAKITLIDACSGTKLEFTGVQGRGICNGVQSRIQELRGDCNGGTVELAMQVDRRGQGPVFEGQIRCRDVALDSGMKGLAYLSPVFAGMNDKLDGKLNLDLYVQGEGTDRSRLAKSLSGHGRIVIDPLVLDGSKLLELTGQVVELSPRGQVGSARSDLTLRNGQILSDNLTLDVAPTPLVFAGSTDYEGRVSYRLRTDGLTEKLPNKAREILRDLAIEIDDLADVRFEGSVDSLRVTFGGESLDDPGPRLDHRMKLREIGRRLRDRVLR